MDGNAVCTRDTTPRIGRGTKVWTRSFSMFDRLLIIWSALLLSFYLPNFYYHLTYFMFELTLAEIPDEPNRAFWTLIKSLHIFNHCNPPGIMDISFFLLPLYVAIYYYIHINLGCMIKLTCE